MKLTRDETLEPRAASSEEEDDTLDIVRLMIEAEARHAQAHPEAGGRADGAAPGARRPPRATEPAAPARTGSGKSLETPSEGDAPADPEQAPRKRLRRPRLSGFAPHRRAARAEAGPPAGPRALSRHNILFAAKLAALALFVLLVVLRPWLLPLMIFMAIWLALILFLLLGSERLTDMIGRAWSQYRARRPARAARVLTGLQRAADRADGLLARLPERWADGIYTPDLGRSERELGAQRRADLEEDPFARLARK